ncbi:MAG: periplasmic heavy metal sensor [Candidatus Omnitrophica bacterium]|nr:periplasmic heavy metal sensor [Candidatus Omnitrophota bacterium]
MKTNINTVVAVIVVAAVVAGNAFAGTECGTSEQRGKGLKAKDAIARELNLSADQQNRLEQAKTAHRKVMETLRNALKEKRRELQDAVAKPDITRQQVDPILAEIKKLQSDMADKRVDGIFAVKGILSPEQFAKLQSMKEKRMRNGNKKRGGKERQ